MNQTDHKDVSNSGFDSPENPRDLDLRAASRRNISVFKRTRGEREVPVN